MPVRKFLDICTKHLPQKIINQFKSIDGVIVYDHGGYGSLLWVPEDPDEYAADYQGACILTAENMVAFDVDDCTTHDHETGVPEEVLVVQRFARNLDCDYVLFDRDADTIPELPHWDW